MIKKFKAVFGKNDHAHSTTDELDLFDFAYTQEILLTQHLAMVQLYAQVIVLKS